MIRPTSSFLAAISFAVIAAWCADAGAAPKVALTPIDGDLTGEMREAVAEALDGDELTVLGERETNRAVDKLGDVSELSEKQAKKLGTELAADAVVMATFAKKGKTKFLRFKLFVNGKKLRGFKVQFKNERSPKFQQALRDKIVERLDGAVPGEDEPRGKKGRLAKGGEAGEDDEDPNPKTAKPERDDEDEEGDEADDEPRKGKKRSASRADDDLEEPAIVKRMEPPHAANRVAIRLDTGVSLAGRSLQFTKRANFPEGPRKFKSSPVPGARLEAELYPLAFVMPKSLLAGLGAEIEYDKTLKLNLQTTADADRGKAIPVNQSHFSVGGRFRIPFGRRATSPTLTLGLDYGSRRWKADRSVLVDPASLDLPDTHYKYLAPVLGFRIPLGNIVAFVASGEAMIVRSAGPIQKADSYGKAKVFGGSGEAGFDIVIGDRVAVRLIGEYTQIGYSFLGAGGAQANARDGDPMTKDVGGAADRSYGGTATLGVLY